MSHIMQSLWIGTELSLVEVLCIQSFLHHGHDFHLYAYNPLKHVPDGAVVKDANEILPESAIFRTHNGRVTAFANFFRWVLLRQRGGVWVDMDIICLRPFDFPNEALFGLEADNLVNNAVLGFPAGHFMTVVMSKACEDVNLFQPIDTTKTVAKKILRKTFLGKEKSRSYIRHTEPGGPWYFTKFLAHHELLQLAKPIDWFYPIHWSHWADIFRPTPGIEKAVEGSYAVHLWNNVLSGDPHTDKKKLNLEGTLIGQLCDQYLPD